MPGVVGPERSWSRRDVLRAGGAVGAVAVVGGFSAVVPACSTTAKPSAAADPLRALGTSLAKGPSGQDLKAAVPDGLRDRLTDPAAVATALAEMQADVRRDFAEHRIVVADGWRLSTTEGTVLVAYATR